METSFNIQIYLNYFCKQMNLRMFSNLLANIFPAEIPSVVSVFLPNYEIKPRGCI